MNLAQRCLRARTAASRAAVSCLLMLCLIPKALPADNPTPKPERLPANDLFVFHKPNGNAARVQSLGDWQRRRAEIVEGMQAVMGPLPGNEKRCPLDVQIEREVDGGSYLRRLITYRSEPGSRVPAYLLVPKSALLGAKKVPAVLALHPTDRDYGKRVIVEELRPYYWPYGRDLAERGYIVLAPAYPLMAEYQPDLKALGYQSGTMKAIWDNIRGLDLLESFPCVQKGRIGAIGHSLGGHNALFTAVFDPRIQVLVSSCGFDSFADYYGGDPAKWQAGSGWCQDCYMPRLAQYGGRLSDIPFDFYEVLGALAPLPVFVNAPLQDENFGCHSVDRVLASATAIYRLYGADHNVQLEHPDGGHSFPPKVREDAYRFLDEHLR
ncbi:MAG TPA: hypothetical protein VMU04_13860 [Candidatus Acidoferrum sp.]|nr:hypothetical protein [Candidatus Acidoferrum sp.]